MNKKPDSWFSDNIGLKFNKLTILEIYRVKYTPVYARCLCDCGVIKNIIFCHIKSGRTRSCSCINKRSKTHGDSKQKLNTVFLRIKDRCLNPNNKHFHNYGGRGINICEQWIKDYPKFKEWALANGYKEGVEIDRIDNNGNYEPSNCRFVTRKENSNNRRTNVLIEFNGIIKNRTEWAEFLGLKVHVLRKRLDSNWPLDKAFYTPTKQYSLR